MLFIAVPISPERWMELLKLYGPMALFVFMVFVLLRIARPTAGLNKAQTSVQVFAYAVVWISIFVLAAMIVIVFWKTTFPGEYVVRGKITNLTYPEAVTTEQELFLHRHTVAGLDFEYEWRLISQQRFAGTLELLLQKKPTDVKVLKYKLPIRNEFYGGTVEVEYNQTNDQMILKYENSQEAINPSPASIADEHSPRISDPEIVYANVRPQASPETLILALDADDPLIRQSARRDLAKLGSTSLPYLAQVLTNPKSSYRLRVEVLAVLKDMGGPTNQNLSEAGRCSVLRASHDSDPTIQEEAKAVLASGVEPPSNCSTPTSPLRNIRPAGLAYLPSGMLILDGYNKHIFQVQSAGLRKVQNLVGDQPLDIAALQLGVSRGAIFVLTAPLAEGDSGRLEMYSDRGSSENKPQQTWKSPQPASKTFSALAADSATSSIYLAAPVLGLGSSQIMRLDLHSGTNNTRILSVGEISSRPSTVDISAMAIDGNKSRLFAVDSEGTLFMVKLPTNPTEKMHSQKILTPKSLDNARGLALGVSSNVFYVIAKRKVWKLQLVGNSAQMQQFASGHNFLSPSALAVDPNGNVWVADEDDHTVCEIAPDEHVLASFPR
jgi:hypothetical protein